MSRRMFRALASAVLITAATACDSAPADNGTPVRVVGSQQLSTSALPSQPSGVLPSTAAGPASGGVATTTLSGLDALSDDYRTQLSATLSAWDVALAAAPEGALVVVDDLWQAPGDWSALTDAERSKEAVLAGAINYTPTSDPNAPPPGTVRAGGQFSTLPLVSAQAAVELLRSAGTGQDCAGCSIDLSSPVLTTIVLPTGLGDTAVPAWDFTVSGTAAHLTRVAIDPAYLIQTPTITPLPDLAYNSLTGVVSAHITGPNFLQLDLVGSLPMCQERYTPMVVESEHSFSVFASIERIQTDTAVSCPARSELYTVDITLNAPVGDRVLVDAFSGRPIPLDR